MTEPKSISLPVALVPVAFLLAMLGLNVYVFGDEALSYPNQLALLFAGFVAAFIGFLRRITWRKMAESIIDNLLNAIPAIFILLMIGALAGSWLLSGVVPAMIYYGLQVLSPTLFLFTACVICSIVSIATGSSWGTIATIGIALLGIGNAMGFPEGLVAGAIISGAYFGDKMSPLSDTTNLAPAVSGGELFSHIRYMTITTVPTMIITLVIFLGIGFFFTPGGNDVSESAMAEGIANIFNITPLLFLVPVTVLLLIIKKIDAVPALFIGTLLALLAAFVFQQDLLPLLLEGNISWQSYYSLALQAIGSDFSIPIDDPVLSELLSTGGMAGMLNTVWLIICAMIFGGLMDGSGCLARITNALLSLARSTPALFTTTGATCVFMNATASDQYLAIVVPGKMFAKSFEEKGLKPENLSRTLEDCGTVTSVLVPWNTCGATQAGVLGVATGAYLPYCFFNLLSPVMTLIVAYSGHKLAYSEKPEGTPSPPSHQ